MIYYIIQTFVCIMLIMNIFVVATSNIRNAGSFIRFFRHFAYSIPPLMYLFMILLICFIAEIFNLDCVFAMIMILMLVAGCFTAYAEKFFTWKKLKKSDKKRVRAEKRKLCVKSEYAEKLTPLTEKKG
ncbi:MAG: hypothetical protein K2O29_09350 [Ruminococcus sp.]|nr:hypothetical protein [Ruminococcus sp.]MDE6848320.1 hypothetical protein [Ruminococcus sp.]MDE7138640.1 hypothetical protein [Ruminococcus sp.]